MDAYDFIRRLGEPPLTYCRNRICEFATSESGKCEGHPYTVPVHLPQKLLANCEALAIQLHTEHAESKTRSQSSENEALVRSVLNKNLFTRFFKEAVLTIAAVGDLPRHQYGIAFNADFRSFRNWAAQASNLPHEVSLILEVYIPFVDIVLEVAASLSSSTAELLIRNQDGTDFQNPGQFILGWDEEDCIGNMCHSADLVLGELRSMVRHEFFTSFS